MGIPVNRLRRTALIHLTREPGDKNMKMRAYLRFCLLNDVIAVLFLGAVYLVASWLM